MNWTIHRKHFSQMTGILDLMHALSYAYRAATALDDPPACHHFAEWIWQGDVGRMLGELRTHQQRLGRPEPDTSEADPRQRIGQALTYYTNHQGRMNYPAYRREGLPLTSSHIELAIKQINSRVKGTEKFWKHGSAESVLQLCADSLGDPESLQTFWLRWCANLAGSNQYRPASTR